MNILAVGRYEIAMVTRFHYYRLFRCGNQEDNVIIIAPSCRSREIAALRKPALLRMVAPAIRHERHGRQIVELISAVVTPPEIRILILPLVPSGILHIKRTHLSDNVPMSMAGMSWHRNAVLTISNTKLHSMKEDPKPGRTSSPY